MKSVHTALVILFCLALLGTTGCFSYHSTKEVAEPSAATPNETSTTTTTTRSDDGTVQQRSITTYPSN
jgi:VCBS repeat-containing protein